jgi:ABC-type phosphate/phosphonate transport system substrate-binding protein
MSKSIFLVCPHDTVQNPDRWYHLEQYIIHQLGVELQFEIMLDFEDFHANLDRAALVYANSTDSLMLAAEKGFTPIARPKDMYDEAVLVANPEIASPTPAALQGAELVSVTSLLPTHIARHMLSEQGVTPATIHNKDSWLSVISSVWNKEHDYGIVYKDTYEGLSEQGKSMVQAFATSNERKAFHCLMLGPTLAAQQQPLTDLLLAMGSDAESSEILTELHIPQWVPVTSEEFATMQQLKDAYT